MAASGVQNYLNTLIFCIVAKTITVLVLGLLIFKAVRPYAVLLLTIEVGLVFIIIWSMIKIARYDKRMAEEAEKLRVSSLNTISCPDFYVRGPSALDPSVTVCKNEYTTPDEKLTYKFVTASSNTNIDLDNIPIDDLFRKQTLESACKLMATENDSYSQIPWTDLHPKCSVV